MELPEDMELLKTRVFHKDDPAIPKNSLHVFPKLVMVNEYNHKKLNETEGELEVLTSKNIMPTRKEFNPKIDKDGKVDKTSLDHVLYLKKDVRVVLVHNIDVSDGLNNGAKGKVLDFIRDQNGLVTQVVVQFDIPETGHELKETQTIAFKSQYPLGTPISKLQFQYSFSKKQAVQGQQAICIQFPLRLGFAMTIHKIQGGTVQLGNSLVSSFKEVFGGPQAYTVLSRIKQLDQLYLLEGLFEDKIYTSQKSLKALKELEERAINDNYIGKREDEVNIVILNVQNLMHHIEDVRNHTIIHDQNLIVLSETWIAASYGNDIDQQYSIPNFTERVVVGRISTFT